MLKSTYFNKRVGEKKIIMMWLMLQTSNGMFGKVEKLFKVHQNGIQM